MFVSYRTLLCFLTSLLFTPAVIAQPSPPQHTVNVLVDVSGSMLQNDPDNKRIDAIKLLINLLPEGSRAGIWLFAQDTQLLSKTDRVNAAWKKKAIAASQKIHSRGLFTHIEDAIGTAISASPLNEQTSNLILLTDGMVDISKDIMVSADSRERVISDLIPMLQQRKVKVHTIALSEHADKPLLDKLAFDTGGWAESPLTARQLQKTFLTLFNKSVPQDTLPLTGNRFTIDKSVKEFSLLIFKQKGSTPTILYTPKKKALTAKTRRKQLSWINAQQYDLITVKSPLAGQWTIDADMDPDNQVMVMTDLKLHLSELPEYISSEHPLDFLLHFTEQDTLIEHDDFLKLVALQLTHTTPHNKHHKTAIQTNTSQPGHFTHTLNKLTPGQHKFKIVADGKTFQREIIKTLEVVESAIKITHSLDKKTRQIILTLSANTNIVDPSYINAQATLDVEGESSQLKNLSRKGQSLLLKLDQPEAGKQIIVNFTVMTKTLQGSPLTPNIKPVIIDDDFVKRLASIEDIQDDNTEADASSSENTDSSPESDAQPPDAKDEESTEQEQEEQEEEEGSWLLVSALVIVINLILIGGGFFVYKWMQKRAAKKQDQLLERLI